MDTYFRGNSAEVAFCAQVGAGGNHLVVCTAGGQRLKTSNNPKLRERELSSALEEFRSLPADVRRPKLIAPADIKPARRPVPNPPPGGLIIRGYCTYLGVDESGRPVRKPFYYYKRNPDRWQTETQSDMLWLTAGESKSLVPDGPSPGERHEIDPAIQHRFYSTIGIDYMGGSIRSLPIRESTMTVTVEKITDDDVSLRLDGYAHLGHPFDESAAEGSRKRGCEVRVLGKLSYNLAKGSIKRFDVVGLGRAWNNRRGGEVTLDGYPWHYGIACELVTGRTPKDLIPPYNMLHYNGSGKPYFPKR